MLRKISHSQKNKYCIILFTRKFLGVVKFIGKVEWWLPRACLEEGEIGSVEWEQRHLGKRKVLQVKGGGWLHSDVNVRNTELYTLKRLQQWIVCILPVEKSRQDGRKSVSLSGYFTGLSTKKEMVFMLVCLQTILSSKLPTCSEASGYTGSLESIATSASHFPWALSISVSPCSPKPPED